MIRADATTGDRAAGTTGAGSATGGILLTGATGFLGGQLLARYLTHTDRRVYALVRAASQRQATARLRHVLGGLFGAAHPYDERVIAVRGDITRHELGLGRRRLDTLAGRVSEVVHGAASVSFELGLDATWAINVAGSRRVIEFAERCQQAAGGLRRLTYVSTAYVAGEHAGGFSEDELDVGQCFRNPYEQSKFEVERMLAPRRERLPITIVRPSIIVGERCSGWTSAFNVLYWPLRAFSRGVYAAVPARADSPVDVVPVDYVADAVFALGQAPEAVDGTFHVTAGRDASSVGELVELASAFFDRPAPRLINPAVYRRLLHPLVVRGARDERQRRALRRSEVFFPYFDARVRYDDRRARAVLHDSGIESTPLPAYFDRLAEFALAADWGRRQIPQSGVVVPLSRARPLRDTRRARRLSPTAA